MTDTHSLTDAATAVVSTPAVGVMHAVATPQPPQPPRLRSPSSPPPSHPPPPPSRGVGVSTTRDIPALVIQLTRELRHDSLSGVAALVHLKVVQAATAEEFHRATVANEEGQKVPHRTASLPPILFPPSLSLFCTWIPHNRFRLDLTIPTLTVPLVTASPRLIVVVLVFSSPDLSSLPLHIDNQSVPSSLTPSSRTPLLANPNLHSVVRPLTC